MNTHTAIEAFIVSRKAGGYKPSTIANNHSHLRALDLPNVDLYHIDHPTFEDHYAAACETRSPGSAANILHTWRTFANWCRARKHVPADWAPDEFIRTPKYVSRERMRVPVEDFPRLIAAGQDARDRAVITTALTLLLRQGEIASLRIGDVNLTDGEVNVVIHKSSQTDTMPIPLELDRELRTWIVEYAKHVDDLTDDMLLFPARRLTGNHRNGGAWTDAWEYTYKPHSKITHMESVAKDALEACGYTLERSEGMHTLRRSGARALFDRLVAEGYDGALRMVQSMLHHASITTTEHYIGLTLDRKRRDDLLRGATMYPTLQPGVTEVPSWRSA